MLLCPNCLHAVPDDLDRCPFCSEELESRAQEEIDERIEWKIVRTVSTEIEARLMAGRLIANGIPAFVLSQVDSTRNFTVGALAVAKVFVPETLLEEAKRILATPADAASDQDEA
jgi:Putative prokaryotic signal transducing protein